MAAFLVPGPTISELGLEDALHHVGDVVSNDWKELPAMERAARGHVEALAVRMGRDEEIVCWSRRVPDEEGRSIRHCVSSFAILHWFLDARTHDNARHARHARLHRGGDAQTWHNSPANAIGIDGNILHFFPVKPVQRLASALLEELDELGSSPNIVHALVGGHGQALTGEGTLHKVGKAHVAVELDSAVFQDGHALACAAASVDSVDCMDCMGCI